VSAINIIITRINSLCVCVCFHRSYYYDFLLFAAFFTRSVGANFRSVSAPLHVYQWHCLMFIVQFPYMLINFPGYLMMSGGRVEQSGKAENDWDFSSFCLLLTHLFSFNMVFLIFVVAM